MTRKKNRSYQNSPRRLTIDNILGLKVSHENQPPQTTIPPSVDVPALLICWNYDAVANFINFANSSQLTAPSWMYTQPPYMSTSSFLDSFLDHLSQNGVSRCGYILLSPNTVEAYSTVLVKLSYLALDPFIQGNNKDFHTTLGTLYALTKEDELQYKRIILPEPAEPLFQPFR